MMRRRGKQWLGFLVMVVGACLLVGPFLAGELQTRKQDSFVAEMQQSLVRTTQSPVSARTPASEGDKSSGVTALPAGAEKPEKMNTAVPAAAATPAPTARETVLPTEAPAEETALSATAAPEGTEKTAQPEDTPEVTGQMMTEVQESPAIETEPAATVGGAEAAPEQPTDEPVLTAVITPGTIPVETTAVTETPAERTRVPEAEPISDSTPIPTEMAVAMIPEATLAPTAAPTVEATAAQTNTAVPTLEVETRVPPAEAAPTPVPVETSTAAPTPEATEIQDPLLRTAIAYNQALVEQGQDKMHTSRDVEIFQFDARDYGFSENAIGTISIPKLNVEVVLFLGASGKHMSNGFAVFGMTSLPLGMGEENVAIAGHRGWYGAAMLRDIQMLIPGDPIYITTPWRQLTYRVSEIEIVSPTNLNWCKLQSGKTMISLMTCHPYGNHTHRYIVHAELEAETAETAETAEEPQATPQVTELLKPAETTADTVTAEPTNTPVVSEPHQPVQTTAEAAVAEADNTPLANETPQPPASTAAAAEGETVNPMVVTETGMPEQTIATAEIVKETPAPAGAQTTEVCASEALPTLAGTVAPEVQALQASPTFEGTELPDSGTAVPEAMVCTPGMEAVTTAAAAAAIGTALPSEAPTSLRLETEATFTAAPAASETPFMQTITLVRDDGTRETILIDTSALVPDDREYSSVDWSNTLIVAENSMRPVAYVTAGVVALVGIWLLIATIRDGVKERRTKHHDDE